MPKVPDIIPITDLRQDAAGALARVRRSREPVVITQCGRAAAVMLSMEAYEHGERDARSCASSRLGSERSPRARGANWRQSWRKRTNCFETPTREGPVYPRWRATISPGHRIHPGRPPQRRHQGSHPAGKVPRFRPPPPRVPGTTLPRGDRSAASVLLSGPRRYRLGGRCLAQCPISGRARCAERRLAGAGFMHVVAVAGPMISTAWRRVPVLCGMRYDDRLRSWL